MQLQARPGHRMLRCGRLVLVVDLHGQVDGEATEGLFVNNIRMSSRLQLRADGQRLATLAMSPTAANELVGHYQVPASDTVPQGSVGPVVFDGGVLRLPVRLDGKATARLRLKTRAVFDGATAPPSDGPGAPCGTSHRSRNRC